MSAPTVVATSEPQAFFTRQEAAKFMRVSVDVIQAAVITGVLRAKRTGRTRDDDDNWKPAGKYLISRAALEAWFEQLEDA